MSAALLVLTLLIGFAVLLVASDLIVRGAASLARRSGLPPLLVGLTIVAFGASLPELLVTVRAVRAGAPDLAIGDIVGANIADVLLALSIPTLYAALPTERPGASGNALVMVAAVVAFVGLSTPGALGAPQGALLLLGIVVYTLHQARRARAHRDAPDVRDLDALDEMPGLPHRWAKIWACVAVGLLGLPLGSLLVVRAALGLAEALEAPQLLVGLTLVALGTSLPEIATAVIAARRGHGEVAVGNVAGSIIFNCLLVGGLAAIVGGMPVPDSFWRWDYPVMMICAFALAALVLARRPVDRVIGLVLLLGYLVYIIGLGRVAELY